MFVECPIIISFVEEAITYINSALRQDLITSDIHILLKYTPIVQKLTSEQRKLILLLIAVSLILKHREDKTTPTTEQSAELMLTVYKRITYQHKLVMGDYNEIWPVVIEMLMQNIYECICVHGHLYVPCFPF